MYSITLCLLQTTQLSEYLIVTRIVKKALKNAADTGIEQVTI